MGVTKRVWPDEISVNMLSKLTGRDRATITKRLDEIEPLRSTKTANYYNLRQALDAIYEPEFAEKQQELKELVKKRREEAKAQKENTLLTRKKRESLEIDIEIKKKSLIPKDDLMDALSKTFGGIRSRLLNIAMKASQTMPENPTKKQVADHISKHVNEALKDLSENNLYESL